MATPNFTAGDVMDSAAALLNDSQQQIYTYAVQIPFLKVALRELREYLELSNIPVTNEVDTVLAIPAGTTVISFITTPALPTDLISIRQLFERVQDTNPFFPMTKVEYLPAWIEGQEQYSFNVWAWINNEIRLPSCVQINDLKLNYIREITNIVDENSQLELINGQTFLEFRCAALCAEYIGENKTRADDLNINAQSALDRSIGIENKAKQSIFTRRRPFRSSYKARGRF